MVMEPGPVAESATMGQNHAEPVLVAGVAVAAIWIRRLSSVLLVRLGRKWSYATPPTPTSTTSARIGSLHACASEWRRVSVEGESAADEPRSVSDSVGRRRRIMTARRNQPGLGGEDPWAIRCDHCHHCPQARAPVHRLTLRFGS